MPVLVLRSAVPADKLTSSNNAAYTLEVLILIAVLVGTSAVLVDGNDLPVPHMIFTPVHPLYAPPPPYNPATLSMEVAPPDPPPPG